MIQIICLFTFWWEFREDFVKLRKLSGLGWVRGDVVQGVLLRRIRSRNSETDSELLGNSRAFEPEENKRKRCWFVFMN